MASTNVPFDVPTTDHNNELWFNGVALAVKTSPSHTFPVGRVLTVGAGLIVITISSKSIKPHNASDFACNLRVTEFNNKSAAEKL